MPKDGEEVYLTEIEVKVLAVFVSEGILDDSRIANICALLANKLWGGVQ